MPQPYFDCPYIQFTNINKISFWRLFRFFRMRILGLIVEKLHRFVVVIEIFEEVGEECLVVSENLDVLGVEVDPNLDSVEGLE